MNDFASTPELILLPAVDVADGKAVRLTQGTSASGPSITRMISPSEMRCAGRASE